MNKLATFFCLVFLFLLNSCGVSSGRFKLEGKFLHMNQGEFYIYSLDGIINGVDTIKVEAGRFTYEMPCEAPTTLMLVFPNFSEQPVFAESGKEVDIQADVSHLKQLTVKGTKTNELMNSFREQIQNVSPPEETEHAEQMIRNHPESAVSVYLLRRYFINSSLPDYAKAATLSKLISKAQPENADIERLSRQIDQLKASATGANFPSFSASDVNGKLVSSATLTAAPVAVVSTWCSSIFESTDLQRELKRLQRRSQGKLQLLSICTDANKADCQRFLKNDTINWPTICQGNMMADKTLQTLALTAVPDNLVLKNGKIVARGLRKKELIKKIEELLK